MSETMIKQLATTYDHQKNSPLGVWRNPNETKIKIDEVVSKVLGLNNALIDNMRTTLACEPMVTGKRYGKPMLIEDYTE